MVRKIYLIDTENVGSVWKVLLEQMGKNDSLLLFYTENSPGISYPDLRLILDVQKKLDSKNFEMIPCHTGRNGLDFQLVSYLGYLIRLAPKTEYYIISNDSGYDACVKFWKERDIKISRLTAARLHQMHQDSQRAEETTVSLDDVKEKIKTCVQVQEPEAELIIDIMSNTPLTNLQQFHSKCSKQFGQETGTNIYRNLKPHLKEFYSGLALL